MALRATDGKKLLAFSSMGHLGLAVAGVFSVSEAMLPAVLMLLVAHGISAGAQFYLMGIAERMAGTRELDKLGGLSSKNPVFSTLFGFAGVMALAVPGTAGFVGEFSVLLSLWDMGPLPAVVAGFCLILSAAYMLRFVQKVIFGKPAREYTEGKRMTALEGSTFGIMVALLLTFGFHPAFITNSLHLFDEDAIEEMSKLSGQEGEAAEGIPADSLVEQSSDAAEPAEEHHPMTEKEIAQLDSTLAEAGFDESERAALIQQMIAADAAQNGEAAQTNAEATENE